MSVVDFEKLRGPLKKIEKIKKIFFFEKLRGPFT